MQKLVFINGSGNEIDLTSGNFGITNWEGFSNTSLNIQTQQVPFEDGGVFLDALMEQREIAVTVAIYDGNNLELRYQKKRELISALNPKFGEGTLIYTNDYLSKQIKAVPQIPLFENKNSNDAGTLKASVAFSCPSPYWEDVEETEVNLNLGEIKSISNNGDIPAQLKIYINNGTVNPIIKNNTIQKEIQLLGNFNKNIEIDTNVGNKKAITMNMSSKYVYGRFADKMIKKDGDLFLYCPKIAKLDHFGNLMLYNPPTKDIISVCLFHNRVVACGIEYNSYSDDGINFIPVINPADVYMYDICTDGVDKIVATGAMGKVITSVDGGGTWQEQTSGVTWELTKIIYVSFLGIYVAISMDGLLTSSDGVTWNSIEGYDIRAISCDNSRIVCSGNYGVNKILLVSENGIDWNYTIITQTISEIMYDGNNFICLEYGLGSEGTKIYKTKDGSQITLISENNHTLYESNLFYFSNIYYALNQTVSISTDLINWETKESIVENSPTFEMIIRDNEKFVIYARGRIYTSNDGQKWKYLTTITGYNYTMFGFAYGKGTYVLGGRDGKILISQDLINWNEVESGTSYIIYRVKFINDKFYAVGYGGICLVSENAIDWTVYTVGDINYVNRDIEYFKEYFYLCNSHGQILKTNDFVNIEIIAVPYSSNYQLHAIAKNKDTIVIVGGIIVSSTNGVDWIVSEIDGNNIAFGDNTFVVVSSDTGGKISSNGISWDNLLGSSGARCVVFHNNFVLVGYDSIYITEYKEQENIISQLSNNSDMGLYLEQGDNQIQFNCDNNSALYAKIVYRQKYIGV